MMSVSWLDRGESDSITTFSTNFSLRFERTGDGEVRTVRTVIVSMVPVTGSHVGTHSLSVS